MLGGAGEVAALQQDAGQPHVHVGGAPQRRRVSGRGLARAHPGRCVRASDRRPCSWHRSPMVMHSPRTSAACPARRSPRRSRCTPRVRRDVTHAPGREPGEGARRRPAPGRPSAVPGPTPPRLLEGGGRGRRGTAPAPTGTLHRRGERPEAVRGRRRPARPAARRATCRPRTQQPPRRRRAVVRRSRTRTPGRAPRRTRRPGPVGCRTTSAGSAPTQRASSASRRSRAITGIASSISSAARCRSPAARACSTAWAGSPLACHQSLARRCSSATSSGCCSVRCARRTSANRWW